MFHVYCVGRNGSMFYEECTEMHELVACLRLNRLSIYRIVFVSDNGIEEPVLLSSVVPYLFD